MNLIVLFARIFRIIKIKKEWQYPEQVQILIYDKSGSELFLNYFSNYSFSILHTRGEILNIPILFRSFFKRLNYQFCYLDYVNPKIVITYIDNNPFFYTIKSHNPNLITIFVQNGIRSIFGDVFENLIDYPNKMYFVDYMFCVNKSIANKYCEYVNGKTISIGSFKNNTIPISLRQKSKNNNVVFISQFRNTKSGNNIMMYNSGKPVFWENFYSAEKILLPILHHFCKKQNRNNLICGCSHENISNEINFYNKIFGSKDWQYIPRTSSHSAYDAIDDASYVVTIDSTLGYEAVSRNKKVAFFTIRGEICGIDGLDFGWPNIISKKGPFWTNCYSYDEVARVLNYIFQSQDEIWNEAKSISINNIMNYDNYNSKFQKLINSILEK